MLGLFSLETFQGGQTGQRNKMTPNTVSLPPLPHPTYFISSKKEQEHKGRTLTRELGSKIQEWMCEVKWRTEGIHILWTMV